MRDRRAGSDRKRSLVRASGPRRGIRSAARTSRSRSVRADGSARALGAAGTRRAPRRYGRVRPAGGRGRTPHRATADRCEGEHRVARALLHARRASSTARSSARTSPSCRTLPQAQPGRAGRLLDGMHASRRYRSHRLCCTGTATSPKVTARSRPAAVKITADYSFGTRFSSEPGTNPEELLAASLRGMLHDGAHATLTRAGHAPTSIDTSAKVHLHRAGRRVRDSVDRARRRIAVVPGILDDEFQQLAMQAKETCPISRALRSVPITLNAAENRSEAARMIEPWVCDVTPVAAREIPPDILTDLQTNADTVEETLRPFARTPRHRVEHRSRNVRRQPRRRDDVRRHDRDGALRSENDRDRTNSVSGTSASRRRCRPARSWSPTRAMRWAACWAATLR